MDLLLFFKPMPIVDTTGQGLHVHTEIGTKTLVSQQTTANNADISRNVNSRLFAEGNYKLTNTLCIR